MFSNLIVTCNVVLPLFLVMLIGYLARVFGLIDERVAKGCNKLVFRLFLPVSLCRSIMRVSGGAPLSAGLVLFTVGGVFAVFLLGMLLIPRIEKDDRKRGVMVQGLFRSNYAIFGVPLCEALFPQGDGGVSAMMVAVVIPLFNALAVISLETFRGGRFDIKKILLGVVKNPLIWGCAIGFVIMKTGLALPGFIDSTVDKLASIASPLALFVLGASLQPGRIKGNFRQLAVDVSARLVIIPAIMLTAAYFLGWRGPEFAALVIVFSSPIAVSSFAMAEQMDGDPDLAVQQIVLTTVFSSVTIFGIIFLARSLGIL